MAVSLSCLSTSSSCLLAVPHHFSIHSPTFPLCCRQQLFTSHVVVDVLRLSSIFWRKGQTLLLKAEMVKPPSHGQLVQDTSKISILFQYSNSVRFDSQLGKLRTHKLWTQTPRVLKAVLLSCCDRNVANLAKKKQFVSMI